MTSHELPNYEARLISRLVAVGLLIVALIKAFEWIIWNRFTVVVDSSAVASFAIAQIIIGTNRLITLATWILTLFIYCLQIYSHQQLSYSIPVTAGVVSAASACVSLILLPQHRQQHILILSAGSLCLIGQQISQYGEYVSSIQSLTYDIRTYLIDLSFGFSPTGILITLGGRFPLVFQEISIIILALAYNNIILAMAGFIVFQLSRSLDWKLTFTSYVLSGLFGGMLYHLYPAAGPLFAFPTFPELPDPSSLTVDLFPLGTEYARNCMPSLHTTWALLIVLNCTDLRRFTFGLAIFFAGLTMIATVISGQHYLIDLVVAVPFTIATQALSRACVTRTLPGIAFWIGCATVAIWFYVMILHVEWLLKVPGLTAIASILTVASIALDDFPLRKSMALR